MSHARFIALAMTSLASGLCPPFAVAAQTLTTAAETPDASLADEIIITARRRVESLQNVPISVTAFSGKNLRSQSVEKVEDLQFHTPALQIVATTYGTAVPSFTIRSQHQLEAIMTQDPSVGIYLDEVVQQRPHGTNAALFDLESVQVLKGPQGTLFGRDTTGGAVLITTAKPKLDRVEGEIAVSGGDYRAIGGTAVLNLPLSKTFAIRVGFNADTHRGYSTNLLTGEKLDDQHSYSWRVSALWQPTDRFSNSFVYTGFQDKNNGVAQKVIATRVAAQLSSLNRYKTVDFHDFESNLSPRYADTKAYNLIDTASYDLSDAITLRNIAGYRNIRTDTSEDTDGSSAALFESRYHLDADQFSDELQLTGKSFDNRLDWVVGAYYFRESGNDRQDSFLFGLRHSEADVTNISKSIYAQGTYAFANVPGLSLTAGVRYTWDDRTITARNATNGVCRILTANVGGVPIAPCAKTASARFSEPTFTLAADYKITSRVLAYATARRGYRSGGFNLRAGVPAEFAPFKPEKVMDYEAGLKADWSIGQTQLRTNLAAYHDDYRDVQRTTSFIDPNVNAFTTVTFNAQRATINGVEADATWSIGGLELRGYVSYSHAKYNKWLLPTGVDLSANKFSYAPATSGGGSARYTLPLAATVGDVSAGVDYYRQGSMQMSDINEPTGVVPAYGIWNARLDWEGAVGSKVDLALYVKNLTDRDYASAGNTVYPSVGFTSIVLGAPRTVGAELRYRFGG